jgi:hypothetical protein
MSKEDEMIADILDGGQKIIYNMALEHVFHAITEVYKDGEYFQTADYQKICDKLKALKK